MAKTLKKIILSLSLVCILALSVSLKADSSGSVDLLHELEPTSNFFTQVEDTTPVEIVDRRGVVVQNFEANATISNQGTAYNDCYLLFFVMVRYQKTI